MIILTSVDKRWHYCFLTIWNRVQAYLRTTGENKLHLKAIIVIKIVSGKTRKF